MTVDKIFVTMIPKILFKWTQNCLKVIYTHTHTYTYTHDADPGPQDPVLWLQYTNTHGLQKSCGEKGAAWPLSKLERGPRDPHLDRLLLFF